MRPSRPRLTLGRMMVFVALCAFTSFGWVALPRGLARLGHLESARDHAWAEKEAAESIRRDFHNARVCLRYAIEGRPVVSSGLCGQSKARERRLSRLVASGSVTYVPPEDFSPRWVSESCWWVSEAFRDAARSAWHASMRRKYESASTDPLKPLGPDPPRPFRSM